MVLIISYHFSFNFATLCFNIFNILIVYINNIFFVGLKTKANTTQCIFVEFKLRRFPLFSFKCYIFNVITFNLLIIQTFIS